MTLAYSREKFESPAKEFLQKRNEPPFSVCLFRHLPRSDEQKWPLAGAGCESTVLRSLKSFSHGLVSEKRTHGFIGISWDI